MAIDGLLRLPDPPVLTDHDVRPSAPGARPGHADQTLQSVSAALDLLDELPGSLYQAGDADLTRAMTLMLRLRARSEQLATLIAAEAAQRGTISSSTAANTTQWVSAAAEADHTPLDSRDAYAIATVADHCAGSDRRPGEATSAVIATALASGRCSAATARSALLQVKKVQPVIPTASHDEVLSWYLALDPALGVRGQRQLTRRVLAQFAPDRLGHDDEALERTETLHFHTTETGMTRMTADLAPANAAIVKEALLALSAPQPGTAPQAGTGAGSAVSEPDRSHAGRGTDNARPTETDSAAADTSPDPRTPGKRRVDALISLVTAATRLEGTDAVRLGPASRIIVTIPVSTLTGDSGAALTSTGDALDIGAARRLACDTDLIPAVLGTDSEPLDVGRSKRLVTGGLRTAVILRDRGCTFPGCDRPPQFCEAHHVRPWWAGGSTSLRNSALLCSRHHQTVHRHGYTAAVSADAVTWDLTPGRINDQWAAA